MFSSTIEILAVENEERTSKKDGKAYQHFAARCVLRADDGKVITVGTIRSRRVTPELRDTVRTGLYRATFALQVPDYGDDKGDVVTMLTGLVPIDTKPQRAAAQAS